MIQIKELLEYSLQSGASDLHLSVGSIPMVRIHGVMKKLQLPKLELKDMESIRNEALNENQKKIFAKNLELDFSTSIEGGRFRVNFFHQIKGLTAVFRTIPNEIKTQVVKKIEEKKSELKNIYHAPKDTFTLVRVGKWSAIQIAKLFFGMPIIPGR